VVGRGALVMGALVLVAGCHAKQQSGDVTLLGRISRAAHPKVQTPKPGELAEKGRAAITEECAKQSYDNARKGLIVSETGLHEDVFALRDRVSYGAIGYQLDEALRLVSLLQSEANGLGHPTGQTACIREFAEHLETLTDPLVEWDERQKELSVSAFQDSAKEAQEQADKKLREADSPAVPKPQPSNSLPRNY
jgi:hypothetical protein